MKPAHTKSKRMQMQKKVRKMLVDSPEGVVASMVGAELAGDRLGVDHVALALSILRPLESAGLVERRGERWYST